MSTVDDDSPPKIYVKNMMLYRKGCNREVLLKNITLNIQPKDTICIRGEIGCGKTSLLNVLGLLDVADDGELLIGETKTNICLLSRAELDSFIKKYYAYVFQTTELMMQWTALENVALPIIARGFSKEESQEKAKQYCIDVGLKDDEMEREVSHLSGGQKQLVGIARALAKQPKILIADEPTAHLDKERKIKISRNLILNAKKQGTTVIVATHDELNEALFNKIYKINTNTNMLERRK